MAFSLIANQAQGSGVSPVSATYGTTPVQNTLLIASVKSNVNTNTISDGGSAWISATSSPISFNGGTAFLYLWYKLADAGQAATVTVTGGTPFLAISNWNGNITSAGLVDTSNVANSGTTAQVTTAGSQPSVITNNAADLVYSAVALTASVTSPIWTGATLLQSVISGGIRLVDGYQIETALGTYSPSLAWTTSRQWAQITMAFSPATNNIINARQLAALGVG